MRIFGGERIYNTMEALNMDENLPLEFKMLTNAIENAQQRVESRNFASRKNVLEYDDVMNKQRELIYAQRNKVLDGEDVKENILSMIDSTIDNAIQNFLSDEAIHDN